MATPANTDLSTGIIVIIERDIVIANDLMEMFQEHDPQARVRLCRTMAQGLGLVGEAERVRALITNLPPEQIKAAGLAELVLQRGGHIVVVSGREEPSEDDPRWIFVQRFLTSALIATILRNIDAAGRLPG